MIAVYVGKIFNHRRVLSTENFDGKTPQPYQVTRITQHRIYYRPIYALGLAAERLGACESCEFDNFERVAGKEPVSVRCSNCGIKLCGTCGYCHACDLGRPEYQVVCAEEVTA